MPNNPAGAWRAIALAITALRDIGLVSKPFHQHVPGARDPVGSPARGNRLSRKAVAGHGGQNEIESVRSASAIFRRIGERPDDLCQFENRAWPAVRDQQWHRAPMARLDVGELDIDAIDPRDEFRQGVQLRLGAPPIIADSPVAHEVLDFGEFHALRLVRDELAVGPPRRGDALAKIVERGLRDGDMEGSDQRVFRGGACRSRGLVAGNGIGLSRRHGLREAQAKMRCKRESGDGGGDQPAPAGVK
jgi:hypothetical protein